MKRLKTLLRYEWPMHFVLLFTNWLPDNVVILKFRGWLASHFLKKCGKGLAIGRNITFYDCSKIEIGDNVYIAYGCWFSPSLGVKIGNEVIFGPYCVMAASNHSRMNYSFRYGPPLEGTIVIEDGCWIGAHSCLLANTHIEKGSLVAANSVVYKIVPESSLVGGSPAKFIKKVVDQA